MVRVVTQGRPDLTAIDDVLIAIANRFCLYVTQVRAMVWLREALTPDFIAGQNILNVALAIFFRAHVQ